MALPIEFPEANFTLLGGETGALDLKCYKGDGVFYSAWKLSPEELKEVNETGVLFIGVHSYTTCPPISVSGNPFKTQEEVDKDYFLVLINGPFGKTQPSYVPRRLWDEYFTEFWEGEIPAKDTMNEDLPACFPTLDQLVQFELKYS